MGDILKSGDSVSVQTKIVYDAQSTAADHWMRDRYQAIRVELDAEEARDFEQAAKEAGLTIQQF